MKKILLILVLVNTAYSQGFEEWIRYYDGTSHWDDICNAMTLDISGNIYVTGYTQNNVTGEDYTTIKYYSNGDTAWVRKYNKGNQDVATAIAVDNSGNVYISGTTGDNIITTIKYNSTGDLVWANKFSETNAEFSVAAIKADNSGNLYVSGSNLFGGFVTFKYNSTGVFQWLIRYPISIGATATGMCFDNIGNIVVCGFAYFANDDFVTIKYSPSGETLWTKRYDSGSYDHPSSIAADNSGNVYVTGESSGSPFSWGAYVYCTVKYDLNGNLQWVKNYDGQGSDRDYAQAIAVGASGNIYITGYSSGLGNNFDYATVKYNSNGDSLWVQRYNGPANSDDLANSITLDNSENVYVTGTSTGFNGHTDCATIKYNSSGVLQWTQRFHSPSDSNAYSNSVKVDTSGNVIISGGCFFNTTNDDFMTIKYSNIIGIQPASNAIPNKFNISQNYPNPFNPTTKIRFAIPSSNKGLQPLVILKVYDALGREVETLVNEQLIAGTYEADWNAAN